MEWNHVGPTLQLGANSTTLPLLNPPLTKGRRLAERNLGKNAEPTPTENPKAPSLFTPYFFRPTASLPPYQKACDTTSSDQCPALGPLYIYSHPIFPIPDGYRTIPFAPGGESFLQHLQ